MFGCELIRPAFSRNASKWQLFNPSQGAWRNYSCSGRGRNNAVVTQRRNGLAIARLDEASLFIKEQCQAFALRHFGEAQGGLRANRELDIGQGRPAIANAIEPV